MSEVEIPKMMQEMNITKLKLKDGESVEVKPFYYASISQGRGENDSDFFDRRSKAFKWLRENGLGDIIKNDITVTFGRDEDNKALQYAELAKVITAGEYDSSWTHKKLLDYITYER